MAKEKVLIIEDDEDIANLIKDYLELEEFYVSIAASGDEGIKKMESEDPQLVILDIMLPNINGIDVCRSIRNTSLIPIIMVSAKSGDMDKILSLGVGADDYMTKPFSPMELVARVKAHLRRFTKFIPEDNEDIQCKTFGDIKVYPKSYNVTVKDKEINLTTKEFKLLDFLTSNPGQVFSKAQLYDNVWGYNEYMDENTIAVYVKRLREKLVNEDNDYIKTIWGVGYKWEFK